MARLAVLLAAKLLLRAAADPLSRELILLLAQPVAFFVAACFLREAPPLFALRKGRGRFPFPLAAAAVSIWLLLSVPAALLSGGGEPAAQPRGYALAAAALRLLVVCPVLEELLFRGLVLEQLLPQDRDLALLVSAALFAASHGDLLRLPALFCCGVLLSAAALCCGVAGSIRLHILLNLLAFPLEFLPPSAGLWLLPAAALLLGFAYAGRRTFLPLLPHKTNLAPALCDTVLLAVLLGLFA